MFKKNHKVLDILKFCGHLALTRTYRKKAILGAVGFRRDGGIVHAINGGAGERCQKTHAEARLCLKLDKGTKEVYVARISRDTMDFALAKPCVHCMARLKHKGVKTVYYSIAPNEYGVINLND